MLVFVVHLFISLLGAFNLQSRVSGVVSLEAEAKFPFGVSRFVSPKRFLSLK